ncbi:hypothetical protein Mapa_008698 [Marchantia paleacea]|nr:hypothetical protein Mapa_008698 [Marchantia paleacea]
MLQSPTTQKHHHPYRPNKEVVAVLSVAPLRQKKTLSHNLSLESLALSIDPNLHHCARSLSSSSSSSSFRSVSYRSWKSICTTNERTNERKARRRSSDERSAYLLLPHITLKPEFKFSSSTHARHLAVECASWHLARMVPNPSCSVLVAPVCRTWLTLASGCQSHRCVGGAHRKFEAAHPHPYPATLTSP